MKKFYSITFDLVDLTDEAQEMLSIARRQSPHFEIIIKPRSDGLIHLDVIDYDALGSDDTLSIRVKSNLSFTKRCEKFGMTGLSPNQMKKDEYGSPIPVNPLEQSFAPTDEHVERLIEAYGEVNQDRRWSVSDASKSLFGRIKGGKIDGNDAMNAIASEFWEFCRKGMWSPVIPRGRGGGRNTMADEPTKRRNISVTDADWEYLQSIGSSVSDGIREAIKAHKSLS